MMDYPELLATNVVQQIIDETTCPSSTALLTRSGSNPAVHEIEFTNVVVTAEGNGTCGNQIDAVRLNIEIRHVFR